MVPYFFPLVFFFCPPAAFGTVVSSLDVLPATFLSYFGFFADVGVRRTLPGKIFFKVNPKIVGFLTSSSFIFVCVKKVFICRGQSFSVC